MTPRARLGLCLALVTTLFVFHVQLKTAKIFRNPTWDARDETGQFWSEAASALYATLYPSYGRTVKNLFLREDFAIPLIVFALFFTVRALQQAAVGRVTDAAPREVTRPTTQILAGTFWLGALASWHLTQ